METVHEALWQGGIYPSDVTMEEKFVDGVNVYDQPVVIEDDVWVVANVTILEGSRFYFLSAKC